MRLTPIPSLTTGLIAPDPVLCHLATVYVVRMRQTVPASGN